MLPYLFAMFVLMLFSALFSGSEAALFSLRDRDRRKLARGQGPGVIADELLKDPERLLSTILFVNLLVNMTYFTLVAIVAPQLSRPGLFTGGCLIALIFFSEMLPKSLAVMAPLRISITVAVPMQIAVMIASPILPIVKWVIAAAGRLIWPSFQAESEINIADIERAIDLGTDDAILLRRERTALRSLVGMSDTRVDELMRPRSKLSVVSPPMTSQLLVAGTPPGGYFLVADADDESNQSLIGSIAVRLLRPQQFDSLDSAIQRVLYFPWSARVSQVFDRLIELDLNMSVIVNEFGEVVGALSIDDIMRAVLASGDRQDTAEDQIKLVGGDHYRMHGSTSMRTLAKTLGIDLPEERTATVAGHLQRHNERVPRVGDVAPLPPYELVVSNDDDEGIWIEAWLGPQVPEAEG